MAGLCRLKPTLAGHRYVGSTEPLLVRLFRLLHTRPYATFAAAAATSAQPQLDPDYYRDNMDNEGQSPQSARHQRQSLVAMADSEGSVPLRGVQWVFIGTPGAKKHVYAEKLSKLLEVPHISMVSLVRQDLNPRSSLYKQIANALNHGTLVPEEIIFGLLSKRLEDGYHKGETGFILDGIPRTQIQAEVLDHLVDIDLVVNFKCPDDGSLEHYGSSFFSHCCRSVGIRNFTCTRLDMASEGSQSEFSMSNEESIWKKKVHVNTKQLKPLEDYYKKQKKLLDFQVGSAPGETWQGLLAALHLQHIDAVHSNLLSR